MSRKRWAWLAAMVGGYLLAMYAQQKLELDVQGTLLSLAGVAGVDEVELAGQDRPKATPEDAKRVSDLLRPRATRGDQGEPGEPPDETIASS